MNAIDELDKISHQAGIVNSGRKIILFDDAVAIVARLEQQVATLTAENAEFKRIRDLLVRALMRAIGTTDKNAVEDPLTAAIQHAEQVAAERARSKAKIQQFYTIAYEALNIAGGLTKYVGPRPELTNAERAIERLQKELYVLASGDEGGGGAQ